MLLLPIPSLRQVLENLVGLSASLSMEAHQSAQGSIPLG